MSGSPTQVWFINGQLVTNNPQAFANQFEMPSAATVDGISRVSHRMREIPRTMPVQAEGRIEAISRWLASCAE